jgi:hypothetical protein
MAATVNGGQFNWVQREMESQNKWIIVNFFMSIIYCLSNEYRKKPFSCVDFGVWLGVESLTLWDGQ